MDKLHVTKTRFPSRSDFCALVDEMFNSGWVTNQGQLVQRLEHELQKKLNIPHILSCTNGTFALMLSIAHAGLSGKKVAVTAYTYVATLSALLWQKCVPIFVDIEPQSLCMSPSALRKRLIEHPDIAGVIPVHVYGLVCDVESIEEIAQEHSLTLVYDAAQGFGSSYQGQSLLVFGDYAICSFHGTKIFHTAEGGCIVMHTPEAHQEMSLMRAFGHKGDTHYCLGINGKMSELHAAMGLALLQGTDEEIKKRKACSELYDEYMRSNPNLAFPTHRAGLDYNYAYYPVLLSNETTLLAVMHALAKKNVFPRRYFYPALNTLKYLSPEWKDKCPVAEGAASRVLCLPLYGDMLPEQIYDISCVVNEIAL